MVVSDKSQVQKSAQFSSSPKPKKIGLITPAGLGNLGDYAIQQAIVQNIRRYHPTADIYGITLSPKDTEAQVGIPGLPLCSNSNWVDEQWWLWKTHNPLVLKLTQLAVRLRSVSNPIARKLALALIVPFLELNAWIKLFRAIKGFSLLVVSGGGQLEDLWGGPWAQPFALWAWSLLAKLRGIPFSVVSVGAGPISQPLTKWFIKQTLSLSKSRSYRDKDSKEYIKTVVGFDADDLIYPDLSHSLHLDKYQSSLSQFPYTKIVGIGPMTYLHPELWPEHDSSAYWSYLNKLASFTDWLLKKKYGILFFTGEVDTDRLVIRDLRDLLDRNGAVYSEGQIIEEPIETVDDLMSELAKTDLVISARFHGTILPQLLNKPVLAISHHRKVEMLMVDSGLGDYSLPIDTFDVETMKERFIALEANQEHIKQQLAQRTEDYKSALDEQYERLFKNL